MQKGFPNKDYWKLKHSYLDILCFMENRILEPEPGTGFWSWDRDRILVNTLDNNEKYSLDYIFLVYLISFEIYEDCSEIIETLCLFCFLINVFGQNLLSTLKIHKQLINNQIITCMNIFVYKTVFLHLRGMDTRSSRKSKCTCRYICKY
jgi:hypothetical protein